jgi:hypothetical protein
MAQLMICRIHFSEMRLRLIVILMLATFHVPIWAQIKPDHADAIKALLLHKDLVDHIFFYYDTSDWRGDFFPPPGNYAFIHPDTNFQKIYPNIINEFPNTLNTDGILYKRTFYRGGHRGIFINGTASVELEVVFTEINIGANEARINFLTTAWMNFDKFRGKYIEGGATLRKKGGHWYVKKITIKKIPWRAYFMDISERFH